MKKPQKGSKREEYNNCYIYIESINNKQKSSSTDEFSINHKQAKKPNLHNCMLSREFSKQESKIKGPNSNRSKHEARAKKISKPKHFKRSNQTKVASKNLSKMVEQLENGFAQIINSNSNQPKLDQERKHDFYKTQKWRQLRYQILRENVLSCALCRSVEGPFHVDHIKPRSKYPELALSKNNLQILCESCNVGKSNKYIDDWRKH
jgi:5-methylcytosine-specific restriction endonuclease McrA